MKSWVFYWMPYCGGFGRFENIFPYIELYREHLVYCVRVRWFFVDKLD